MGAADGSDGGRTLTLRRRTESDLPTIVGWVPDAEALFLFSGPSLTWPLTVAQLRDVTTSNGLNPWVLIDPGVPDEPLGHFDLGPLGDSEVRLGRVIVDPSLRGKGLGSVLASGALRAAWNLGMTRVRLNVIEDNIPAIRVYERLGFVLDGPPPRPGVVSMLAVRGNESGD